MNGEERKRLQRRLLKGIFVSPKFHINFIDNIKEITFFLGRHQVTLALSKTDWKRLLDFFKKTKSRKYLPKNCEGYQGFTIDSNQIMYFNFKKLLRIIKKYRDSHQEPDDIRKKQDINFRRDMSDVKRNLIPGGVFLKNNGCTIFLTRKEFIQFRDGCLKNKEHGSKSWF